LLVVDGSVAVAFRMSMRRTMLIIQTVWVVAEMFNMKF
jgi:hypothetical protein